MMAYTWFTKTAGNFSSLLAIIILTLSVAACQEDDTESLFESPELSANPIVVIYENDVHCAVDGYARLAGVRNTFRRGGYDVATVSCGDFVQGDIVGSVTRGEGIIDIMNYVGYDVVTLGNHEFDFGLEQMYTLTNSLNADVVNANFCDLRSNKLLFEPYTIKQFDKVDIAFLGVTTTSTATSVAYTTFTDENGNVIYSFNPDKFFEIIQQSITKARADGADYVVVLSHLGDSGDGGYQSSIDLIRNTMGIDVVLDGHDHNVIPDTTIINGVGEKVLLSSTGAAFANVGVLTLSTEGGFTSRLIAAEDCEADNKVQTYVEQVKEQAMAAGERVVGVSDVEMPVKDGSGTRIVRTQETAIGNFCADALRAVLGSDIAFVNGGAIRADIYRGDVTYNALLKVFPFNNSVCTATMTGSQIMDALEVSTRVLPKENGGFLQVSGIKFKVDTLVASSVQMDENGLFSHVSGARRVSDVEVLDKSTNEYLPIIPERTYTIASSSFLVEDYGDSGILRHACVKETNLGQDVDVPAIYLEQILKGRIGAEYGDVDGRIVINGN